MKIAPTLIAFDLSFTEELGSATIFIQTAPKLALTSLCKQSRNYIGWRGSSQFLVQPLEFVG
jgi:hypothetical protein